MVYHISLKEIVTFNFHKNIFFCTQHCDDDELVEFNDGSCGFDGDNAVMLIPYKTYISDFSNFEN